LTSPAIVSAIALRIDGPRTGKIAVAVSCGLAHRLADRAFDCRRERDTELSITIGALHDRLRQMLGDLVGRQLERVESAAKLVELPPLAAEQQIAEFGELANA